MGVSLNGGTPKSSILIWFSIINPPICGYPAFLETPTFCVEITSTLSHPRGSTISCNGRWGRGLISDLKTVGSQVVFFPKTQEKTGSFFSRWDFPPLGFNQNCIAMICFANTSWYEAISSMNVNPLMGCVVVVWKLVICMTCLGWVLDSKQEVTHREI